MARVAVYLRPDQWRTVKLCMDFAERRLIAASSLPSITSPEKLGVDISLAYLKDMKGEISKKTEGK